jgi:hypothetical protein
MPFEKIPGTDVDYGLMSFDAAGRERTDDPAGLMSRRLIEKTADEPITDVFFFNHGWHGDITAAQDQYDRWIGAFITQGADLERARAIFPMFQPLLVGLHWPSEPWGDEDIPSGNAFGVSADTNPSSLLNGFATRLGDTPEIRRCLETILDEARGGAAAKQLSTSARNAYLDLNGILGIGSAGVGAAPDADRDSFDPDEIVKSGTSGPTNFGAFGFGGILAPLRVLSYWTMKKRARTIGEGGMHIFLKKLMTATVGRKTRIHLMGHSFGTIVVSGMLGGPNSDGTLPRPVESLVLVQGAVSLWSYCQDIPFPAAGGGYFKRLLTDRKVSGPIVTTKSEYDHAVGILYPLASKVRGAPDFVAGLPKFGGIGTFGIQGLKNAAEDSAMLTADRPYNFKGGKVYNLDGSQFISKMEGLSGAHNDIAGPEVAHSIWESAFATR